MNKNTEIRPRVTAKQWSIVAVLAVVFAVVLVMQFGSSETPSQPGGSPQATDASQGPAGASRAANARGKARGPTSPQPDHPWPTYSLATVLKFDPFAAPSILAEDRGGLQPSGVAASAEQQKAQEDEARRKEAERKEAARKERERVLAEIQKAGVQMIMSTDQGFVAVVGTKTVHVGDRLQGFRVKEIKPDGIILEDNRD